MTQILSHGQSTVTHSPAPLSLQCRPSAERSPLRAPLRAPPQVQHLRRRASQLEPRRRCCLRPQAARSQRHHSAWRAPPLLASQGRVEPARRAYWLPAGRRARGSAAWVAALQRPSCRRPPWACGGSRTSPARVLAAPRRAARTLWRRRQHWRQLPARSTQVGVGTTQCQLGPRTLPPSHTGVSALSAARSALAHAAIAALALSFSASSRCSVSPSSGIATSRRTSMRWRSRAARSSSPACEGFRSWSRRVERGGSVEDGCR